MNAPLQRNRPNLLTILVLALAGAALMSGCASSPKLYPNKKYEAVGKDGAQADVDDCQKKADAFVESPTGKKMAKGAATGGVVGGAVGAVFGLFTGNVVRGAAVGAGTGAAAGAAHGAMSPDQIKRAFVNKCLRDKGYEVLGWD